MRKPSRSFRRLFVLELEDRTTPDVGDTIATAFPSGLTSGGFLALDDTIGDNAFAGKDVDFFAVSGATGERLTVSTRARVVNNGVDTHLRLFNAAGTSLAFNNDYNGSTSRLTLTLPEAGKYFVGVSGSTNTAYNPTIDNSGVSGSTGDFAVTISLAAPVSWASQGLGPIINGQVEGMSAQSNPVAGAIECISPHPTNAYILYAGGVNGGIWRTTNATASSPTWLPLTDSFNFPTLSIRRFGV